MYTILLNHFSTSDESQGGSQLMPLERMGFVVETRTAAAQAWKLQD